MNDPGEVSSPSVDERVPDWLTDDFLERYLCWREACREVRAAYDHWHDAERPGQADAFIAYGAALDREESAARDYCQIVQRRGGSVRHVAT
jgi:hypothetical protein